jgi:hypothetical protein
VGIKGQRSAKTRSQRSEVRGQKAEVRLKKNSKYEIRSTKQIRMTKILISKTFIKSREALAPWDEGRRRVYENNK